MSVPSNAMSLMVGDVDGCAILPARRTPGPEDIRKARELRGQARPVSWHNIGLQTGFPEQVIRAHADPAWPGRTAGTGGAKAAEDSEAAAARRIRLARLKAAFEIGPQYASALLLLCDRAGEVVPTDEMLEAMGRASHSVTSLSALAQACSELNGLLARLPDTDVPAIACVRKVGRTMSPDTAERVLRRAGLGLEI